MAISWWLKLNKEYAFYYATPLDALRTHLCHAPKGIRPRRVYRI